MKKIGFLLLTLIFSPLSYALDAKGTIDEIKICGTGIKGWIRTLQFKIDNKWFGTYSDYNYGVGSTDHDDDQSTSLIMMAYAQNAVVDVRFTTAWGSAHNKCGVSQGATFRGNAGDYIKLSR